MTTNINSKHGIVSKQPAELYMAFADLRNFLQFIPEGNRGDVTADYDSITATVQGFKIGIMIKERTPYSRIDFIDDGAPFQFSGSLHFDAAASDPYKTDFYIEFSADLNLMMKMLLGKKLKEGMDKVVDALVAMSEGRMPEGVDEDALKKMKEELDKNRQQ
ncbi:MAG: hypothetical protein LKJ95_02155 [Bacteroidales bacterium]|jgi:ribosome-associated toxin RatA of RatAB toxin-antitoxin module|nr:hypothetical protein [Bacteroidales bacterium]